MVVNHIRKVVGWEAIILHDNLVVNNIVVKDYLAVH